MAACRDRIEHQLDSPSDRQLEFFAEDGVIGKVCIDFGTDRSIRLPVRLGHWVENVPLLHLGIDRDVGTVAGHRLGIGKVSEAI
jgi:hypothetical protein